MQKTLLLAPGMTIGLLAAPLPAMLAARDLALDFGRVFGADAPLLTCRPDAAIVARVEPDPSRPESWTIEVTPTQVQVSGTDALGLVYGLYEISRRFLDVDPLWFWKELDPIRRERIDIQCGRWQSEPAAFRYRGWFLNDEDLLTGWHDGCLPRELDYPYYQQVVHPEVIDRVYETLLRSGGNLVIPASFLNILAPAERQLAERAVARGLYISQHHIEPLGVSHFAFDQYWRDQGKPGQAFEYGSDPEPVRQAWRAFAAEWAQVAGDRVIWQLGLRGRGDRPVWNNDKSVTEETAGALISRALREQMEIVRSVDSRPSPPATTTLWAEGSVLMAAGKLELPPGVIAVFSDDGATQRMQADFYDTPRGDGRFGVYYHIAYWSRGPHLAQGLPPAKVEAAFGEIIDRGDTEYAIINVANIRESTIGIAAAMDAIRRGKAWRAAEFWKDQRIPQSLLPLYGRYFDAILPLKLSYSPTALRPKDLFNRTMTDGTARQAIDRGLRMLRDTTLDWPVYLAPEGCDGAADSARALAKGAAEFVAIADAADAAIGRLPEALQPFYAFNLAAQSRIIGGLYECAAAVLEGLDDRSALKRAEAAVMRVLEVCQTNATGRWHNWYRGDAKMNLRQLSAEVRAMAVD